MASFSAVAASPDDPSAPQQITITGKVTDAATGEALIGVTVLVKGTTVGALTDINGNFTIPVSSRQPVTLAISFIGYSAQEVQATPGTPVNVALALEVTQIQEVVVVGYGVQKKESVVGAITQVDAQTLMQAGEINVTNAITGKLSGVLTIQQDAEPGSDNATLYVRGLSSWNGSSPLVLVDGVERDFSSLDPNEIETISVLKDASATAVFGAKGANGVIVVTTKRGTLGRPKMDFTGAYGLQTAARVPEHIDAFTTMSMYNVALMNKQDFTLLKSEYELAQWKNPSTPIKALEFPDVNWFDECTHDFAPVANANLNITGGTDFAKYFLSFGYNYTGDFFKGTKDGFYDKRYYNHRFNYRINLDFNITKTTILSFNVGGNLNLRSAGGGSWRNLYSTGGVSAPAIYPAWVLEEVPDLAYPDATGERHSYPVGEYTGNPLHSLMSGTMNQYLGSQLYTDLILKQQLDFITKGLSINGKVSLSSNYTNTLKTGGLTLPQYILQFNLIGDDPTDVVGANPWLRQTPTEGNETYKLAPFDLNTGGLGGYNTDLYYEVSLNWNRSFGKHNLTALGLFNRQQQASGTNFPYYNEGLVGRVTYDYNRKYLFEFNIGYTGSERFAPGNRFGTFPSLAVGYLISEEPFFKNAVPWMNRLKIRYSDGYVGSDYARSRWLYQSSYFKDNAGYIHEDMMANTMAQWERAHKRDLGIEMSLFNNLITLTVDGFDEYRDKMLLTPKSTTMLIGQSFKEINLGEVKKHGIEAELEFRKAPTQTFEYWVRGVFGWNENRVVFKDDPASFPDHMKLAGKPLTEMLNVEYSLEGLELNGVELTNSGYVTSVDDIHNNVSPIDFTKLYVGDYLYLDYNSDGTINTLDKHAIPGLTYPPITYAFSGGFTWKNFNFNFLFSGNHGKYVQYNQAFEVEFIKGDLRVHKSALDYWRPDNPNAGHATMHYSGSSSQDNIVWGGGEADRGYQAIIEDRYFRNASYLRLKDLYMGYNIKSGALNRAIGINSMMVYLSGSNLLTFTPLIEGDPEATNFYQGFYPQMMTFRAGIKVGF
ncbi:MAG TPA: TonB-dependent receptor [Bacteroidales bacterium]|nr:TonB-dependent receptor [Bacteroidales bacterium]HPR12529.1 TonB-dependent receptor [Bacteroidales bacterium]HRW84928.1 TonB-dependent receptor [Bacteroidales bacterium]